jgi:hypothetical protein
MKRTARQDCSRRRSVVAGVVFVSMLLGSGCGGGGGDDAATGDGAVGTESRDGSASSVPSVEMEPVEDVVVVRDEAAAAEATIGVEGGSLEVPGGDGAVWTLEVPEGALAADTLIRAVPAELQGIESPAWTLMFEPSGLFFYEFATLSIATPVEVPIEDQFAFTVDDEGSAFGAAPVVVDSMVPTILVGHFSGYGLAQATPPERAALLERRAADAEARIQSQLAEALTDPRVGESVTIAELVEPTAEEYEREVIQPRLEAAGASCEATKQALQTVLGYERQRELLGLEPSTNVLAREILTTALQPGGTCEEEAIRKCIDAQEPSILIEFWVGRERQATLLGVDTPQSTIAEVVSRAKQICTPTTYSIDAMWGDFALTGSICEVGQPFQLDAISSYGSLVMDFTWIDGTSGSIEFTGNVDDAIITGTGSFVVELDDQSGTLSMDTQGTGMIEGFEFPSFVDSTTFALQIGADCQ